MYKKYSILFWAFINNGFIPSHPEFKEYTEVVLSHGSRQSVSSSIYFYNKVSEDITRTKTAVYVQNLRGFHTSLDFNNHLNTQSKQSNGF